MKHDRIKKAEHHLTKAHELHKEAARHHKEAAKHMKHAHKEGQHMDIKEDKKLVKKMVKKDCMH